MRYFTTNKHVCFVSGCTITNVFSSILLFAFDRLLKNDNDSAFLKDVGGFIWGITLISGGIFVLRSNGPFSALMRFPCVTNQAGRTKRSPDLFRSEEAHCARVAKIGLPGPNLI